MCKMLYFAVTLQKSYTCFWLANFPAVKMLPYMFQISHGYNFGRGEGLNHLVKKIPSSPTPQMNGHFIQLPAESWKIESLWKAYM